MPAVTGQPITPAVLGEVWDPVTTVRAQTAAMYEVSVATLTFDGLNSSLANASRYWVPPTDAQIIGIGYTSYSSLAHTGSIGFVLEGNTVRSGTEYSMVLTSLTSVRGVWVNSEIPTNDNSGLPFGVLAGDLISFRAISASYSGVGPGIARVQIIFKHRWSKT